MLVLSVHLSIMSGFLRFVIFLPSWGKSVSLWTFLLELLLLNPIGFRWLCFHCHLSQGILFSVLFDFMLTLWFFSILFFSFHVITCLFSFLFLWLMSRFMPLWSEKMLEIIPLLLIHGSLFYVQVYDLSQRMLHLHSKRMLFCVFRYNVL